MTDVCLFGDINIDVLMSIPEYPPNGGDAIAHQVVLRPGGSAANTAAALARLGLHARLVAQTAADVWSDLALAELRHCGVDLSTVRIEPGEARTAANPTSTGLIFIPITPDGERTMFSHRGANAALHERVVNEKTVGRPGILHLSSYSLLEEPQRLAAWKAVEIARRNGIPLSLDVGVEPARRASLDIRHLLPGLGLLVLGLPEAQNLLGLNTPDAIIDDLLGQGVQILGLKMASRGCLIANHEQVVEIPAWQVDVLDSTGAGDAFCAGMLFGICRRMSLSGAGWLANTLGALATTDWGGMQAMPTPLAIRKFLDGRQDSLIGEQAHWNTEVMQALSGA